MKSKSLTILAIVAMVFSLGLAGCGGGHSDSASLPTNTTAAVPADSFLSQVSAIVANSSDTAEPAATDSIVATAPETTEPATLI